VRIFPRRKDQPKDLPWTSDGALSSRRYPDYATYLSHQRAKLPTIKDLSKHDREFRKALASRLGNVLGRRALCLGARTGAEVRAFRDAGAAAVGIDLNPGARNIDVFRADFHRLPFRHAAFDVLYSNSLDHLHSLVALCAEARRVLDPHGVFVVEAVRGSDEGQNAGHFESFFWRRVDDLVHAFKDLRWRVGPRRAIDRPWAGEQITFGP
jgi:SAM-dependent methyltransferase